MGTEETREGPAPTSRWMRTTSSMMYWYLGVVMPRKAAIHSPTASITISRSGVGEGGG